MILPRRRFLAVLHIRIVPLSTFFCFPARVFKFMSFVVSQHRRSVVGTPMHVLPFVQVFLLAVPTDVLENCCTTVRVGVIPSFVLLHVILSVLGASSSLCYARAVFSAICPLSTTFVLIDMSAVRAPRAMLPFVGHCCPSVSGIFRRSSPPFP